MGKFIVKAFSLGLAFAAGALGETLGETIAYNFKLILFPEFRDAELESAKYYSIKQDILKEFSMMSKEGKKKLILTLEKMEEAKINDDFARNLINELEKEGGTA